MILRRDEKPATFFLELYNYAPSDAMNVAL
jgi:hypothetical protein